MKRRDQLGPPIPASEITPQSLYLRRRELMIGAPAMAAGVGSGIRSAAAAGSQPTPLVTRKGPFGTDEAQTPLKDVTGYNNYYEFGTDKSDPAEMAHTLKIRPWTVSFEGEIKNKQ